MGDAVHEVRAVGGPCAAVHEVRPERGGATNTRVAKESSLSMKRQMGRGYRKTRMWCDYLTLRCGSMRAAGGLGGPRRGGASLCHGGYVVVGHGQQHTKNKNNL